jgi:N-methylhydantoinase B
MHHITAEFPPETLRDGDVLITNDPWMTAGQINDLTVATPVFRAGKLVAWFASCCHSPDIGGRILSAAAHEVFEEGLRLPILKLLHAGVPDQVLEQIIRTNVRTPDETMGDIYAQVAGNRVGARSLLRLMDEFDLTGIDEVAAEVMDRSEQALRQALEALPDGVYRAALSADGFGEETLHLAVAVTIRGGHAVVDYAGSSPQSAYGVNVVLNYTRAYTSFAFKAALAPEVPHNAGSFRPIEVSAPRGSVLNCVDPAPVASRHLVGHFLPSLLFEALRPACKQGLPAASADALWMTVWRGAATEEAPGFTLTMFGAGGSGGRPGSDGLTATGFPTGVRAAPTEVLETLTPLVQDRREIRTDSGGGGEHRGGLGQVVDVRRRGEGPWSVNANIDRVTFAAPGALGGLPGATGELVAVASGDPLPRKQLVRLAPEDGVRLSFPGGGGYGAPHDRPVARVLEDVVNGYVSLDAARDVYGVAITYDGPEDAVVRPPERYRVDEERTRELRQAMAVRT